MPWFSFVSKISNYRYASLRSTRSKKACWSHKVHSSGPTCTTAAYAMLLVPQIQDKPQTIWSKWSWLRPKGSGLRPVGSAQIPLVHTHLLLGHSQGQRPCPWAKGPMAQGPHRPFRYVHIFMGQGPWIR